MAISRWSRNLSAAVAAGMLLAASLVQPPAASADTLREGEYWLASSGITKAWESSKGAGVKVAVIDSGIDGTHQDLTGAVVGGTDVSGAGSSNGQQGVGTEPVHGTLVASVLAGRGHGTPAPDAKGIKPDGVVGVAPEAQLLSVSAWLGGPNPGGKTIDVQIPEAVRWAVDNGAKVINMSLGSTSTSWPQSWDDAFLYAEQHDVVIVAAAGNRQSGMTQAGAPATIPGVLAVGGLAKDGTASEESSTQGITIGVSAPAENLVGALPNNGYANWSGSSAATPIVAGVAALIRSKYPHMSAAQVINRIISTAKPAGDPHPNATYGYGTLDAAAALTADVPTVNANPLGSIADWITLHRRATPAATGTPSSSGAPQETAPASSLPTATTPVALAPAQLESPIPGTLVIGFAVLFGLIIAAGITHMVLVRRRERSVGQTTPGAEEHPQPPPTE